MGFFSLLLLYFFYKFKLPEGVVLAHARAVLTSANRSHLLTESDHGFCSWLFPPPCPHTLFSTGSVGSEAVLSVGQGKLYVCVSRLLFQVLPVVMQIHGVNKHQRKWVCPRLLLQMVWEVDGAAVLQVTGGVCSFFWLLLHKHTDRCG